MTTYRVTFNGRQSGAIGITYPITEIVEADTPEQALANLYGKYEHIMHFKAEPIKAKA